MSPPEVWTIGRLLKWTTDFFKQHSFDNPRLDAEVLLAHVLKCERIQLYTSFDREADEAERLAYRELVRQRAEGMPVAYLVGHREFFSLSFEVTPDVLIPRPETEHLVTELLDRVSETRNRNDEISLVDVGTGSGAIAISLAKHLPQARITAVDVSLAALQVARRNSERHAVADRLEFLEGDLLASLSPGVDFDFVVSNPPYVTEAEYEQLDPQVREREPRMALVGGQTGMDIIDRLVTQSAERLRPAGWLLFEISPMIESAARQRLADQNEFEAPRVTKDLAGLARVVQARRKA
jgi:release factor glutamine methyltransferase